MIIYDLVSTSALRVSIYCYVTIQMESIIKHCFVMSPKEYMKANNEGDDVFMCEYEYDIHWHSFKRLAEIENEEEVSYTIHNFELLVFSIVKLKKMLETMNLHSPCVDWWEK